MRDNIERQRERKREPYGSPDENMDNYNRDQRVDTRKVRDERPYYPDKVQMERTSKSRYQQEYDSSYRREPFNAYPQQDRRFKDPDRPYYKNESPVRGQRYENPRNAFSSQREQYSKYTGIPEEFLKSDAA
jgi:hypothetical protein